MIDGNHLCPGCMGCWEDTEKPCPRCGFSWEAAPSGGRELPPFTILAGRYLLGRKIGIGGFGITYLAMDLTQERTVAIKEFFPSSLADRQGTMVVALPGEEGRYFREALRSFRREAELLARFSGVEGIVPYRDYVTENGTAYLVMDYIEGTNLKRYMRQTGKTFSQDEALGLMRPILLAVDAMHRKEVLHRDVSPENLILKPDGTLTLIDFGAAREYSLEEEENLTVILKHGYAPEEQYHSGSRQGPWTDLYACCAVLYQMVSGIQPQDASSRGQKDDLLPLDEIEGLQVTEGFARAVEKGMTIHASERYASIQALMAELYAGQEPSRQTAFGADRQSEQSRYGWTQDEQEPSRQTASGADWQSGQSRYEYEHEESGRSSQAQDGFRAQGADAWTGQEADDVREEDRYSASAEEGDTVSEPEAEKPGGTESRGSARKKMILAGTVVLLFFIAGFLLSLFHLLPVGSDRVEYQDGNRNDLGVYAAQTGEDGEDAGSQDGTGTGAGTDTVREDGLVWLMTGRECPYSDFTAQEVFLYDDKGRFSQIITYGLTTCDYAGGSNTVADASFGVIVSDFVYVCDENGRIISGTQYADTGSEFYYQYSYWNEFTDIPKEAQVSSAEYTGTFCFDEFGRVIWGIQRSTEKTGDVGAVTLAYDYSDGESHGTICYYCENPKDTETLRKYVMLYMWFDLHGVGELVGVNYTVSDDEELMSCEAIAPVEVNADGTSSVYIEMSLYADGKKCSVSGLYRNLSPDSGNVVDEYGNILENDVFSYSYAEYEVKDGIYTPTGRTSGTLPEIPSSIQEEEWEETVSPMEEEESEETVPSIEEEEVQIDLIFLLETYGIIVDSAAYPLRFESAAEAEDALLAGTIDGLIGIRLTSLEDILSGLYVVFPPEEWFPETHAVDSIVTTDMDICMEITMILLENGYYRTSDRAYEFLSGFQGVWESGSVQRIKSDNALRYELAVQYLEYWGEQTGNDWLIYDEETGRSAGGNNLFFDD